MVSFVNYVLRFRNADSAWGDVARDMLDDANINRRWGYMSLVRYLLSNHNPCGAVMDILSEINTVHVVSKMTH